MRHSFTARAAAALLMLTGAGSSALAQQAQAPQSACYVPGSGTVYRIKEANTPAKCTAGHSEFQITAGTRPSSGPTGPAGGDLGGSYPNPSVVKLQGQPVLNAAGSFDFSNSNGLLSVGTPGTGALPASGAGTRLMWYPAKSAFRAGSVDGPDWDLANIGDNSMALGFTPKASGAASIALGNDPSAVADGAVALGSFAYASGVNSTAIGPVAQATALAATAIGNGARAAGINSTAIGTSAVATADRAIAMGTNVAAEGTNSMALGTNATTSGKTGAFVYGDVSSTTYLSALVANQFVVRAQQFWLGTNNTVTATAGRFLETSTGAYLTSGGAWTNSSDVNRKHAFQTVDGDDVLDKLAAMPVQTWSYKTEDNSVRHMGPTAQEFRKAFGLGDTDKAIATVDADGVSLAGIKALIERTTKLQHDNEDLRTALAEVYRRLAELEIGRR